MARSRRNRGKQGRRPGATSRPSSPRAAAASPPVRPPSRPPALRLSEMLTVMGETDEAGRLLLEDSAPEAAQARAAQAGISMQTEACPYRETPSRYGGEMNVSAYEALRRDTAEMLNGFAWLAQNYLQRDPARRSTVRGLFDTTHLGLTLPLFLFRRGQDPVDPHGQLPTYVASIFKASRGVFSASVDMLNKGGGPDATVTVAEVVEFADRHSHLARADTGRVCAAPTRLIDRTIAVILTGEGADPRQTRLGELVDFPTLWRFYELQDSFNEAFSNYRFHLNTAMESGAGADPTRLFAHTVVHGGSRRSLGDLTEALLAQANATQRDLNRLLGRSERATPLKFEDLMKML